MCSDNALLYLNCYRECARLLLLVDDPTRDNYWRNILENPYTPEGKFLTTTPFRELVKHMPSKYYHTIHLIRFCFTPSLTQLCEKIDVAEVVLHNCTKIDRYLVNKPDFTVECSYDFVSGESESPSNTESMEHPISLMVANSVQHDGIIFITI